MSVTSSAISVLRNSILRKINFSFPGGANTFTIHGHYFAKGADRMGSVDTDPTHIGVEIKPDLEDGALGKFDNNILYLRHDINSKEMEATVCHEITHAVCFYNDTSHAVLCDNEEAAAYVVDVCYYLLTGYPQKSWASGKSGKIKKAALPIARYIVAGNADSPGVVTVDPSDFRKVVTAVKGVYKKNDPTVCYIRDGESRAP